MVGLVGALLGAAVGFIPGIAVTYPLTGSDAGTREGWPSRRRPYLDVPWLMIGVVVVLPLLTALIVGSPPAPGCRWWLGSTDAR